MMGCCWHGQQQRRSCIQEQSKMLAGGAGSRSSRHARVKLQVAQQTHKAYLFRSGVRLAPCRRACGWRGACRARTCRTQMKHSSSAPHLGARLGVRRLSVPACGSWLPWPNVFPHTCKLSGGALGRDIQQGPDFLRSVLEKAAQRTFCLQLS